VTRAGHASPPHHSGQQRGGHADRRAPRSCPRLPPRHSAPHHLLAFFFERKRPSASFRGRTAGSAHCANLRRGLGLQPRPRFRIVRDSPCMRPASDGSAPSLSPAHRTTVTQRLTPPLSLPGLRRPAVIRMHTPSLRAGEDRAPPAAAWGTRDRRDRGADCELRVSRHKRRQPYASGQNPWRN
jgi:hypothetical protein